MPDVRPRVGDAPLGDARVSVAERESGARVLMADDSPEMLGLLTAWLEDEGCMVIAVGSGREALDASIAYRPHVAFVDVVLPPPDGFQLCQILTRRIGLSVVLMTGMSNPDIERVIEAGAIMLLQKPFDREAVIDALTLALAQARREDPDRRSRGVTGIPLFGRALAKGAANLSIIASGALRLSSRMTSGFSAGPPAAALRGR